jgi:hypothetical protein
LWRIRLSGAVHCIYTRKGTTSKTSWGSGVWEDKMRLPLPKYVLRAVNKYERRNSVIVKLPSRVKIGE